MGSTTDILTGVVTGPDGKPLAGATVDATALDGQITRHAQTGNNGRYTILFPDGGGQYRVTIRFIGMAPITFVVTLARQMKTGSCATSHSRPPPRGCRR